MELLDKKWGESIRNGCREYNKKIETLPPASGFGMEFHLAVQKMKTNLSVVYSWLKDDQVMVY